MRIAYAGSLPKTPVDPTRLERGQDGAHGGCSMGHEFVKELQAQGHEAELWNFWDVTEDQEPTEEAYDAVFFFDNNMYELWKKVVPNWDWEKKLSICWMHLVHLEAGQSREIMRNCKLVGVTNTRLLSELEELVGDESKRAFVLPWATTTRRFPPPQSNPYVSPYDRQQPTLLWCGRIGGRAANLLKGLGDLVGDKMKLHIISATVNEAGDSWPYGDLPKNAVWHGPLKHGTFDHFLYYADVAIDQSLGADQRVINCKQYDYISGGLPIVCEQVPGCEIMRMKKHGVVVPFAPNNASNYAAAIDFCLRQDWDRNAVRQFMQANHTWTNRASLVHTKILQWQTGQSA